MIFLLIKPIARSAKGLKSEGYVLPSRLSLCGVFMQFIFCYMQVLKNLVNVPNVSTLSW